MRKNAFQCNLPLTREVTNQQLKKTRDVVPNEIDPLKSKLVPTLEQLRKFQIEIEKTKIAVETFYIETNQGNLTIQAIKDFIQIHTMKDQKAKVSQEISWFNQSMIKPKSVKNHPSPADIGNFRSLLLNHRAGKIFEQYDMSPNELSYLCCTRKVSTDHIIWIVSKLNQQQQSSHFIYLDPMYGLDDLVEGITDQHERIIFIMSVG